MRTQLTERDGRTRSAVLLSLALGVTLAAVVALVAGTAQEAQAAFSEKIVFVSARTTGNGVDNPTGDREVFTMNPNGTGVKQLTFNTGNDIEPTLSADGKKIAYMSQGEQTSNPQGDWEVYVMNALDGSGQRNLTDNGVDVNDFVPDFSPDGQKIAYQSSGAQISNPEGDDEVYVMSALDGTGQNLTDTYLGVNDYGADFSPDGQKIAYTSRGIQTSNPEGDDEVYVMSALDGTGQKNLSNDSSYAGDSYPHFSPDGQKIAYTSRGAQTSNPEGDYEVYVMNALDGTGKKNLSNSGEGVTEDVPHFSPDGKKIAYQSSGAQISNPEGDTEVYVMIALDGSGQKNLTNNGGGIVEVGPIFSPDGKKIAYLSRGIQTSNSEGDYEIYRMNALDGSGKKNLTNNDVEYDESPEWGR